MGIHNKKSDIEIEKLYLQRFSCVDDGMHLELCIAKSNGELNTSARPYPLVTIRADKGDQRKFVIYAENGAISVPLIEIENAIKVAQEEVHSEEYYG